MPPVCFYWNDVLREWQWSSSVAGPWQRYGGYLARMNEKQGLIAIQEALARGFHAKIVE